MGRKYVISDQSKIYFVTFTVINWIDVFIRDNYKDVFYSSIEYCQEEKGLEVYAYCIMTSHIHLIIGSKGITPLSDIIRDLKSFTSRHIRKEIENGQGESRKEWMMWMMKRAGIKNELDTNAMMDQRLDYIHNNPVVTGFVDSPTDWVHSSARDYAGMGNG